MVQSWNVTYTIQWLDGTKPGDVSPSQVRHSSPSHDLFTPYNYSNVITHKQGFQQVLSVWAPLLFGPNESLHSTRADLAEVRGMYMKMLNYTEEAMRHRAPAGHADIRLTRRGEIADGFCVAYDDWGRTESQISNTRKDALAHAFSLSKMFAHVVIDVSSNEVIQKYGNMDFSILMRACAKRREIWSLDWSGSALEWLSWVRNRTQKQGRIWPCQLHGRPCSSYRCFELSPIGCVPETFCSDSIVSVRTVSRYSWIRCLLDSAQLLGNYELIATGMSLTLYLLCTRGLSFTKSDVSELVKIGAEGTTQSELDAMHRGE
mmetsp:Transcript_37991/g.118547  ORF Transcript_37991/g.118547 Transcript_37991/m.118547 type:complete len:318 (+) Transcript_37991:534-1487(+)